MTYEDFSNRFLNVRDQHNIMALVGNGFDIQALSGLDAATDTRYESFYHYLKYRKFDPENRILEHMGRLREERAENWSDVENAIDELRTDGRVTPQVIAADVKGIQREFARFLDQVATPDVLSRLGERAVADRLTMTSFMKFLGDIDDAAEYKKMSLPKRVNIGDVFNFKFINFNYTTLLDDFVYLDQSQFDPHPYKTSDRSSSFHPNPRGHQDAPERQDFTMVSYLVSDVVHPHGVQHTPRSLLFGIDDVDDAGAKRLSKPYWAQNKVKYGDLFQKTDMFIIFGCSLGETDRWWWRSILDGLLSNKDADMVLYWRRGTSESDLAVSDLRSKFAAAAGYAEKVGVSEALEERARVVLYDDFTERAWLNTNPGTVPSWARI